MENFIPRTLSESIKEQKDKFPILAVTGPRQSGKTTLLKHIFPKYEYVSLENPDIRSFAEEDPNGFLNRYNEFVIFDEVQRVPSLFSYLQTKVDESGKTGQFILSGSQNFHLIKNITQSLAGRIALFKLLPFDFEELKPQGLLGKSIYEVSIKGFFPPIFDRDINPSIFYKNYIQTYVERDVSELVNLQNVESFRIFIGLCAHNAGQLLNLSSLATAVGISHTTAKSWLSILQSSYIIYLLQPYHKNFKKRLIKSPKLYFYDTGLLCQLLRISSLKADQYHKWTGSIFENLIIAEFLKMKEHHYLDIDFYFWRDSNHNEVDLLISNRDGYKIFEIKSGQTIHTSHFRNMDYFEKMVTPEPVKKSLIYGGEESQKRTKYNVVSWREINGLFL